MFDFVKEAASSVWNRASQAVHSVESAVESLPAAAGPAPAMGGHSIADLGAHATAAISGPNLPGGGAKFHDWLHGLAPSIFDESDSTKALHKGEASADVLLKDKLNVGGEGAGAISTKDYEKLKENFGKIMAGQGYLQIDTSALKDPEKAAEYKKKMFDDLARIAQTPSGRDLINTMVTQDQVKDEDARKMTTLKPNVGPDGKLLGNGEAEAVDGKGNAHDSVISFNPGEGMKPEDAMNDDWKRKFGNRLPDDKWMPIRSDVLLYHELVHAKHQTFGDDREAKIMPGDIGPGQKGYMDADGTVHESEFQAVGLGEHGSGKGRDTTTENIYRRERRELAKAHPELALGDDANMPDRDTYSAHPGK